MASVLAMLCPCGCFGSKQKPETEEGAPAANNPLLQDQPGTASPARVSAEQSAASTAYQAPPVVTAAAAAPAAKKKNKKHKKKGKK
eukprot:jgi/Tetstr1/430781/TSEL_020566.t1